MSDAAPPGDEVPLYFLTSFARSGETLTLRCLGAHPNIVVSHEIRAVDPIEDKRLVRMLMRYDGLSLSRQHPNLIHRPIPQGSILLVKHGVWVHRRPFRGFTLARNPFAVMSSIMRFSERHGEDEAFRRRRLVRWARGMNRSLVEAAESAPEIDVLCRLYVSKMVAAIRSGQPIIRYEELVADPRQALGRALAALDLPWSERVLTSHEDYAPGELGHGDIPLWEPISDFGKSPFDGLTDRQRARIERLTRSVMALYGYRIEGERIVLDPLAQAAPAL